jgi:hypothetical protein
MLCQLEALLSSPAASHMEELYFGNWDRLPLGNIQLQHNHPAVVQGSPCVTHHQLH